MSLPSNQVAAMYQRAFALFQQGQTGPASALCIEILKQQPAHYDALHMLGLIAIQNGHGQTGIDLIRRSLGINPRQPIAHSNLCTALLESERPAEALQHAERAIELDPRYADAQNNRGNALLELKRPEEALASYAKALRLRPDYALALNNRGNALLDLKRPSEALESIEKALRLQPDFAPGLNSRGKALLDLKRFAEALLSIDAALQKDPAFALAHINRGNALADLERFDEAVASYDRALKLKPGDADALRGRGIALLKLGRHDEALDSYKRSQGQAYDEATMLDVYGVKMLNLKRFAEAARYLKPLIELAPDTDYALGHLLYAQLHCCDWHGIDSLRTRIVGNTLAGKRAIVPFCMFLADESPSIQQLCASNYIRDHHPPAPEALWQGKIYRHERIRLAYLSADFHQHATAHLMGGLFKLHDRSSFEITALSFGPDDGSAMRRELEASFDRFLDVRELGDLDVARKLRELEIDIAVDLKGHTTDARTGILAHRPAPIQVNYLGYPGTIGAGYIDYILADRTVIPAEDRHCYVEKVVYLPDCYQVNDYRRKAMAPCPGRAENGLPEQGFVFCCFNNNYKITAEVFATWMRLLSRVPGSVLWLYQANFTAARNLRAEAARCGVAPERLVFAPRLDQAGHLARYPLASLFLDTLPCNAHTTSSDALWMGVPVLTCIGGGFAGRVAASLLRAAGLPELVTENLEDYEQLALKLATTPELLHELRAKLMRNRESCPLFDTDRTRRQLEAAYLRMWQRLQRGEVPAHDESPATSGEDVEGPGSVQESVTPD